MWLKKVSHWAVVVAVIAAGAGCEPEQPKATGGGSSPTPQNSNADKNVPPRGGPQPGGKPGVGPPPRGGAPAPGS